MIDELLPEALRPGSRQEIEREDYLGLLDLFLIEHFHVNSESARWEKLEYPCFGAAIP